MLSMQFGASRKSHQQQPVAKIFICKLYACIDTCASNWIFNFSRLTKNELRSFIEHQNAHQIIHQIVSALKVNNSKRTSEFDCFCYLSAASILIRWLWHMFPSIAYVLINLYFRFTPGPFASGLSKHSLFLSIHVFVCVTRSRHNSLYPWIKTATKQLTFWMFSSVSLVFFFG